MKTGLFLMTVAAASCLGHAARAADADCTYDAQDAQRDIDKASVIFTGTVTDDKHFNFMQSPAHMEYKTMLTPDKLFKGRVTPDAQVVVVQMHDTWGRYTYFNVGEKYLVLAHSGQLGLMIDNCLPVMSLNPANASSYEPGPEYKAMIASALDDVTLFPPVTPEFHGGAAKRLQIENGDEPAQGQGGNATGGN